MGPSPSNPAPNFAGLLASIASRSADAAGPDSWNDSRLRDDVVALSRDALRGEVRDWEEPPEAISDDSAEIDPASALESASTGDLRTACVTIWMTKTERVRLRRRASESGMTISAYLRSCALEADALREQVKWALVAMKTAAKTETAVIPARGSCWGWIRRIGKRKRSRDTNGGLRH